MNVIKIKDKEYNIKYTIRALFIFEAITGKPFAVKTLLDNYILLYSIILANNQEDVLDWDDFLEALDSDPELFQKINEVIENQNKKDKLVVEEDTGEKKKRKKKL